MTLIISCKLLLFTTIPYQLQNSLYNGVAKNKASVKIHSIFIMNLQLFFSRNISKRKTGKKKAVK